MKKLYQTPDLNVTLLENADVIVTSDGELPWGAGDFDVFG